MEYENIPAHSRAGTTLWDMFPVSRILIACIAFIASLFWLVLTALAAESTPWNPSSPLWIRPQCAVIAGGIMCVKSFLLSIVSAGSLSRPRHAFSMICLLDAMWVVSVVLLGVAASDVLHESLLWLAIPVGIGGLSLFFITYLLWRMNSALR